MSTKMITLNVGGTIYTTSIETLTRYPDSMLGTMFKTQHGNSGTGLDPSNKDEHGRFVIDRDGPTFRFVLNFLRESCLTLPEDFKELGLLRREAEFYQIGPLIEAVDKLVGEAVDMIEPKSSCQMEWIKIKCSKIDNISRILYGKQETLDQIKSYISYFTDQRTKITVRYIPRDISVTVTRFDVLLESVLRNGSQQYSKLLDFVQSPLASLGFVMLSESSVSDSHYWIFVRRTYPDK